jgi:type IV pilus assembly protein PilC
MALFVWRGRDARGTRCEGELSAASRQAARRLLRGKGIRIDRLTPGAGPAGGGTHRIRVADTVLFTRQLATLLKAGLPLVQAFRIVGEGLESRSLRQVVAALGTAVANGMTLSESLRRFPRQFDALHCNLVEAGEQSGTLEVMLDRLATLGEKSEALRARVRRALQYPLIVLVVAVLVSGLLLVKVVPQFAATFASFGAELPLATRAVLSLSDLAAAWWYHLLLAAAVAGLAGRHALAESPWFADCCDRLLLKLPVLGGILAAAALARITRTVATTFGAGLPLVDALATCAGVTGNGVYRQAVLQVRSALLQGQSLTDALRAARVFPPLVVQLVLVGEQSGTLDSMLERCATFYEAAVDRSVDSLAALLEPLLMTVLGALVGGLMIAMYMPIFRIGAVL